MKRLIAALVMIAFISPVTAAQFEICGRDRHICVVDGGTI
jgi:hypothetical protein